MIGQIRCRILKSNQNKKVCCGQGLRIKKTKKQKQQMKTRVYLHTVMCLEESDLTRGDKVNTMFSAKISAVAS